MKIINFKEFKLYTGIAHGDVVVEDVREEIANIIYKQATGIKMHALAHKIYENNCKIEYSEDEIRVILAISNDCCTPLFIDSFKACLNSK